MKKEYVKPRSETFALLGGELCLTVASDSASGEDALSKENDSSFWEDDASDGVAQQSSGLEESLFDY